MKICTKCKLEKQKNDFGKRAASKDGLQLVCNSCRKEYRTLNAEQTHKYNAVYRKEKADLIRAYNKANAKRISERVREYQKVNAEKIAEQKRANPEIRSAHRRNRNACGGR